MVQGLNKISAQNFIYNFITVVWILILMGVIETHNSLLIAFDLDQVLQFLELIREINEWMDAWLYCSPPLSVFKVLTMHAL